VSQASCSPAWQGLFLQVLSEKLGMNALAHPITVAWAGRSRSQEWLSCARVLWDRLHSPRPNHTAQRNDGVAGSERRSLQVNRIHGDLEQPSRVGGRGRLHMA